MAFVTKTWKDRLVEFAGRRKLKNVSTNEEVLYDVSRSEGTVMQAGDSFSAANMNDLEQRIKNEFDTVNSSLGGLSFGKDGDGNVGYYGADGSLIPFKQSKRFVVGTYGAANKTYDIKSVLAENGVDYTKLTSDNFFIKNCNVQAYSNLQMLETNVGISYNSENGTLTLTGMYYANGANTSIWMNVTIWVCL